MGVLDFSDIPTERLGKMRKDANLALTTLIVDEDEAPKEEVLKLPSHNSNFPSLSAKVEVKESASQGRYLVARDIIEPGEVVRREEDTTRLLLTLSTITSRPFAYHLEYFEGWSSGQPAPPRSEPFTQMLHLVKHLSHLMLSPHLASIFLLLHLLRAVSYIPLDTPEEQERQLCLLMCHVHAAIKPNIHASFQVGVLGDQLNQEYLGVELFPTVASCFNHSCDPNTFVVDIGRTQVTVASRRIFEGEEVSQGYGGHFGDTVRDRRQKLLTDRSCHL